MKQCFLPQKKVQLKCTGVESEEETVEEELWIECDKCLFGFIETVLELISVEFLKYTIV